MSETACMNFNKILNGLCPFEEGWALLPQIMDRKVMVLDIQMKYKMGVDAISDEIVSISSCLVKPHKILISSD